MEDKRPLAGAFTIQHWKELFRWETWRLKDGVENRRLLAQLLSFGIIYLGLYGLISFLLPLELRRVRLFVLLVLLVYVVVEHILMRLGILRNFYDLLDENQPAWREAGFIALATLLAVLLVYIYYKIPIPLAFGLWLGIFNSQILIEKVIFSFTIRTKDIIMYIRTHAKQLLWWGICVLLVYLFLSYYDPIRIDNTSGSVYNKFLRSVGDGYWVLRGRNLLSAKTYSETGVLFARKWGTSFRRVDGWNDLGTIPLLALAYQLGFPMDVNTYALIIRNIYLSGVVLFALFAALFIFRSAAAFLTLSLTMITGFSVFYVESLSYISDISAGSVSVLLGLSLLISLPYITKRKSLSFISWWGILCGLMVGLLQIIRANVGYPAMAALLIAMFAFLMRRKSFAFVFAGILSVIVGAAFFFTVLYGLLLYRDTKLQIQNKNNMMTTHSLYNSFIEGLDEHWWDDATLYKDIWNENPLLRDTLGIDFEETSKTMFFRYIIDHPQRLLKEKTKRAADLVAILLNHSAKNSPNWLQVFLVLLCVGTVSVAIEDFFRIDIYSGRRNSIFVESVVACSLLIGMNMIVPIMVNPYVIGYSFGINIMVMGLIVMTGFQFICKSFKELGVESSS